jgi:hypothetical protein
VSIDDSPAAAVERLEKRMAQANWASGDLNFLPVKVRAEVEEFTPEQVLSVEPGVVQAIPQVGPKRYEQIVAVAQEKVIQTSEPMDDLPEMEPVDFDGNVALVTVDGEVVVYVSPDGKGHVVRGVVYAHLPVKGYHGEGKVHTEKFRHEFEYASRVEADVGWTFGWKSS